MPLLHVRTTGGEFVASSVAFLSIWLLTALGAIGIFSAILAVRGLSSQRRSRPRNVVTRRRRE
jgi:hypothetical protein